MSNFQHPGDEWNRFYKEKMVFVLVLAQIYLLKLIPQLIQITSNKFAAAVGYITADPIAPSVVKK